MYQNKIDLINIIQNIRNDENYVFLLINQLCDLAEKNEQFIKALIPEQNRRSRLIEDAKNLIKKYPVKENRPLFFCIPIGVKDIFKVEGFETSCGSQLPSYLFEGNEAKSVILLKNAGAFIFGKTVTTEFAYFEPGATRNPFNVEHTPGGSSSGSAAAVACGFVPLALGTQTIGSITRPASFCGVYGFKTSSGRISIEGVIPFSPTADHIGIFTQDIESIKLTASILCENWISEFKYPDKELIIGALTGKYIEQADETIIKLYNKSKEDFKNKGFKIIDIDLFTDIDEINKIHRTIIASDFALVHQNWFNDFKEKYRKGTIDLIIEGRKHTIEEFIEAKLKMQIYRNKVEEIKSKFNINVWLSPSTTSLPPKGMATGSPLMNLPWTFTGLPTITIPSGYSDDGLPFGLQLAGSFNKDEELLEITKKLILKII